MQVNLNLLLLSTKDITSCIKFITIITHFLFSISSSKNAGIAISSTRSSNNPSNKHISSGSRSGNHQTPNEQSNSRLKHKIPLGKSQDSFG